MTLHPTTLPTTASTTVPAGQIEIWFEFGSPYSYPSVMRIEDAAAVLNLGVCWRPVLLGPVFKSLGWQGSPFLEQPQKLAYLWQDMPRQCEKYGLPWKQPSAFPRNTLLPMRVAMLGADAPWMGEFCRATMAQHFGHDVDVNTPACVQYILLALGLPAADLMAEAMAEPNKQRLREQTERAGALGIFGGPSFRVGDALYWGNDRLDDALQHAHRLTHRPAQQRRI